MTQQTPLYHEHLAAQAKVVDFHGWLLPLHYGSQLEEHHIVRQDCGMFDVSHMTIVDIHGEKTEAFLRYLLANDVAKLTLGKALYTTMLNEQGGIIDDLIVYKFASDHFRLVVNSATREKDLNWIQLQAQAFNLKITVRDDMANIAIQGPQTRAKVAALFPEFSQTILELKSFHFIQHQEWQISATGYTGEDGLEIILPAQEAAAFWQQLLKQNIKPCGLGARDTLRLEAGLNLYGSDMDETISPLEANIAWTVAFLPAERDFIGRKALEMQKEKNDYPRLVGLVLQERGVLRAEQKVFQDEKEIGVTISGTFSPTLQQGIAFARIKNAEGETCTVEIRGKKLAAKIVKLPFVRQGKIMVTI